MCRQSGARHRHLKVGGGETVGFYCHPVQSASRESESAAGSRGAPPILEQARAVFRLHPPAPSIPHHERISRPLRCVWLDGTEATLERKEIGLLWQVSIFIHSFLSFIRPTTGDALAKILSPLWPRSNCCCWEALTRNPQSPAIPNVPWCCARKASRPSMPS